MAGVLTGATYRRECIVCSDVIGTIFLLSRNGRHSWYAIVCGALRNGFKLLIKKFICVWLNIYSVTLQALNTILISLWFNLLSVDITNVLHVYVYALFGRELSKYLICCAKHGTDSHLTAGQQKYRPSGRRVVGRPRKRWKETTLSFWGHIRRFA